MQRGPAGNTSLAAAFALAMEMNEDQIIVVNETEYTGAGKLPSAQLTFAKENGIEIKFGDPLKDDMPGKNIVLPDHPSKIGVIKYPLEKLRKSYIKELKKRYGKTEFSEKELEFVAEDLRINTDDVKKLIEEVL
jgi:hypothetical protein